MTDHDLVRARPRYSLIVATLRDDGDLAHCLESMAALITPLGPIEVIIVDQNEDDRLVGLVAYWAARFKIVHERVSFRSANRARNLGASIATGEWLAFPDDDCSFLPESLAAVDRCCVRSHLSAITGRIVDHAGRPHVLRWRPAAGPFSPWSMFGCLSEPTMFVRRSAFEAVGGFDENFGPGGRYPAAEGIDLMARLFQRFGRDCAYYDPEIALAHPRKIPPWNRWAVRRFADYARGDGALIAKHLRAPIIFWGLRTMLSAAVQCVLSRGARRAAFRARMSAMVRGFLDYRVAGYRGDRAQ